MKEDIWTELSVTLSETLLSAVERELEQLGSVGTVSDTLAEKPGEPAKTPRLRGYLPGGRETNVETIRSFEAFAASLRDLFPTETVGEVETQVTTPNDWQKWRDFFKVTAVSKRVVIRPSWEVYRPKGDEVVVEIDPGMAFGTGTHESTRMCLKLLDSVIKGEETVLDVGSGSGILAIAAAKLGARRVFGIDIHVDSVRVANENLLLNGVEDTVAVAVTPIEEIGEKYDIVVANILAEDLIEMKTALANRLETKGKLILSGILTVKATAVIAAYEEEGLQVVDEIREGEWSALLIGQ